ncbi:MAG: hypothetical protein LBB21_04940 [Holosporaceae bacterium]|jgi:hypothetical protein|nr:hypothetical protein [Holosporaceae bacterium]
MKKFGLYTFIALIFASVAVVEIVGAMKYVPTHLRSKQTTNPVVTLGEELNLIIDSGKKDQVRVWEKIPLLAQQMVTGVLENFRRVENTYSKLFVSCDVGPNRLQHMIDRHQVGTDGKPKTDARAKDFKGFAAQVSDILSSSKTAANTILDSTLLTGGNVWMNVKKVVKDYELQISITLPESILALCPMNDFGQICPSGHWKILPIQSFCIQLFYRNNKNLLFASAFFQPWKEQAAECQCGNCVGKDKKVGHLHTDITLEPSPVSGPTTIAASIPAINPTQQAIELFDNGDVDGAISEVFENVGTDQMRPKETFRDIFEVRDNGPDKRNYVGLLAASRGREGYVERKREFLEGLIATLRRKLQQ